MATFIRNLSPVERRTFWACFGGWGLDAFDFMVFTLAIPAIMATFHVGRANAGAIGSAALFASAFGGWLGGALSDRIGRVKTPQWRKSSTNSSHSRHCRDSGSAANGPPGPF
jgi:hypothetical protein